ncbi:MAG: lysyl-tRNA ligase [Candidatus Parcubacteria bacterium]|jgi:lysyl-tRNA synthetase class 2
MNTEMLKQRSAVIKAIRAFFDGQGYVEMHTPRLVGIPSQEPHLEPLWTEVLGIDASRHPAALITSPEHALKRLLAAGMDKVYDLGSCFRNGEPWDGTHDPEFLMIEWYRKQANLASLMDETEAMVRAVHGTILPVIFSMPERPFRRLTVTDAWRHYAGIDLIPLLENREAMAAAARAHDQVVNEEDTWDDLYYKIFLSKIEPHVGEEPTFLYRYPASQAGLSLRSADDTRFADRVEFYIGGMELANGFAELSDAAEQRARFQEDVRLRAALHKKTWLLDEPFLKALPGMGEAVGIALGVDRLVMLLTGATSINDVIPFSARERFTH